MPRCGPVGSVGAVHNSVEVTGGEWLDGDFPMDVDLRLDGAMLTSDSTLRFRERDEVETALVAHGYDLADVRAAPDRPGQEFVFFARRTN
jgi:hypothetical protein